VLSKLDLLGPALPDVFLYLHEVATPGLLAQLAPQLVSAMNGPLFARSRFARFWVFWFLSSFPELATHPLLGARIWREAPIELQARAAAHSQNVAWLRNQKSQFGGMGRFDRCAFLYAWRIMPRDERRGWLGAITTTDKTEQIIIEWLKAIP
jgi:hypothetical protein